jgi:hypothetical protein
METKYLELPWEEPGWLERATTWIDASLAQAGRIRLAAVEILHQRPWSTFARVITDKGVAFFKAPAPPFSRFEARLTQALGRRRPDCTVPLLGVDLNQGWMLSEEAGVTLRSAHPGIEQIADWERLLPQAAELQIEMAERVPELLGLGMFDRRLSALPQLFDEIMQAEENLRVGLEPGLKQEEYERLLRMGPQLKAWCEELAALGLPETLTHEELHDANVLVNGDRFILTDWSDSSVAHPFFLMVVTTRAAAYRLELDENGPEIRKLRDAYLEPWTRFAGRGQLARALPLAYRLGMLNRALSWHHGTGALAPRHKEADANAVPEWLRDFLKGDVPFRD